MTEVRPRNWKRTLKRLLVVAGVAVILAGGYGLLRGMRYPPLQLDPRPQPLVAELPAVVIEAKGAYLINPGESPPQFRAFAPEPVLRFFWKEVGGPPVRWKLENLHPEARVEGARDLGTGLLDRFLDSTPPETLEGEAEHSVVSVHFPARDRYRFVAVGDTGGGPELDHCLQRAAELGADFILHLGDIGYQLGDLEERGITAFGRSPLPIYVAVGNHDFHGGHRYRFDIFRQYYGPLNSTFELGGVAFLNLDTAADTVPAYGGQRGRLIKRVRAAREADDDPPPLVAFTHRPLDDPRAFDNPEADEHALNRRSEAEWLRDQLLAMDAVVLLAGHVHEAHDFTVEGLRTIISGEGLMDPARRPDTQILVGEYTPGGPVEFHWESLPPGFQRASLELRPDSGSAKGR